MIILDTDHLAALQRKNAPTALVEKVSASNDWIIGATVISIEEQLRGWFNYVRKNQGTDREVYGYSRISETVSFYSHFIIGEYTADAQQRFIELRAQKIRVATQDLKIASIALSLDATLLTANRKDFEKVPELKFENWLQ